MLLSDECAISRELERVQCGIVMSRHAGRVYPAVIPERKRRRVPMRAAILSVVVEAANAHDVTLEQIMGKSRRKPVVLARHAAIRAVAEFVDLGHSHFWSSTAISHLFGMDHTTILYVLGRLKNKRPK